MGAAYFIVLDNPKPGFDTFVNGKAIAREAPAIEKIAKKLKIKENLFVGELDWSVLVKMSRAASQARPFKAWSTTSAANGSR